MQNGEAVYSVQIAGRGEGAVSRAPIQSSSRETQSAPPLASPSCIAPTLSIGTIAPAGGSTPSSIASLLRAPLPDIETTHYDSVETERGETVGASAVSRSAASAGAPPADAASTQLWLSRMLEVVERPMPIAEIRAAFVERFHCEPWAQSGSVPSLVKPHRRYFTYFKKSAAAKYGVKRAGAAPANWDMREIVDPGNQLPVSALKQSRITSCFHLDTKSTLEGNINGTSEFVGCSESREGAGVAVRIAADSDGAEEDDDEIPGGVTCQPVDCSDWLSHVLEIVRRPMNLRVVRKEFISRFGYQPWSSSGEAKKKLKLYPNRFKHFHKKEAVTKYGLPNQSGVAPTHWTPNESIVPPQSDSCDCGTQSAPPLASPSGIAPTLSIGTIASAGGSTPSSIASLLRAPLPDAFDTHYDSVGAGSGFGGALVCGGDVISGIGSSCLKSPTNNVEVGSLEFMDALARAHSRKEVKNLIDEHNSIDQNASRKRYGDGPSGGLFALCDCDPFPTLAAPVTADSGSHPESLLEAIAIWTRAVKGYCERGKVFVQNPVHIVAWEMAKSGNLPDGMTKQTYTAAILDALRRDPDLEWAVDVATGLGGFQRTSNGHREDSSVASASLENIYVSLLQLKEIIVRPMSFSDVCKLFWKRFGYDPFNNNPKKVLKQFRNDFLCFKAKLARTFGLNSPGVAPLNWNAQNEACANGLSRGVDMVQVPEKITDARKLMKVKFGCEPSTKPGVAPANWDATRHSIKGGMSDAKNSDDAVIKAHVSEDADLVCISHESAASRASSVLVDARNCEDSSCGDGSPGDTRKEVDGISDGIECSGTNHAATVTGQTSNFIECRDCIYPATVTETTTAIATDASPVCESLESENIQDAIVRWVRTAKMGCALGKFWEPTPVRAFAKTLCKEGKLPFGMTQEAYRDAIIVALFCDPDLVLTYDTTTGREAFQMAADAQSDKGGSDRVLLQQLLEVIKRPMIAYDVFVAFRAKYGYNPWKSNKAMNRCLRHFLAFFQIFDDIKAPMFGLYRAGVAPRTWETESDMASKI